MVRIMQENGEVVVVLGSSANYHNIQTFLTADASLSVEPLYPQVSCLQSCGSGSGLDPDSETLWIRIRIGNPDPGARKLRNFSGKNAFFSYFLKNFTAEKL
jgi:hypothetical protein